MQPQFEGVETTPVGAVRLPGGFSPDDFNQLCADRCILPGVALECVEVVDAIRSKDWEALVAAVDANF